MSAILGKLGLSAEQVRRMTGQTVAETPLPPEPSPEPSERMDWKHLKLARRRLASHESWILGQFISGMSVVEIAACIGTSEEAIRRRIRAKNLFNSDGKPGKPKRPAVGGSPRSRRSRSR
jgi:hypothetical protein